MDAVRTPLAGSTPYTLSARKRQQEGSGLEEVLIGMSPHTAAISELLPLLAGDAEGDEARQTWKSQGNALVQQKMLSKCCASQSLLPGCSGMAGSSKGGAAAAAVTLRQVGLGEGELHEHGVGRGDGEGEQVGERVDDVVLGGRPHRVDDLERHPVPAVRLRGCQA